METELFPSLQIEMATSSSHLNWLVVRQWNAFQVKKTNIAKPFSKVSFLCNRFPLSPKLYRIVVSLVQL